MRAQDHFGAAPPGLSTAASRMPIWKRRSVFISGAATATAVSTLESKRRFNSSWRAPSFCSVLSPIPAILPAGAAYQLSDLALASRLSFFLWSSPPDDELLKLASEGKLHEHAVLEQQVKRMLADPRADALVDNFAEQWLFLRNLKNSSPDPQIFPDFDDNLRQAMREETKLFFQSIVREDRSVMDLLNADYTFVNERLARHYGIPNVYGSQFRRVTLTSEDRRGLLGQGSILTVTSYPNRTSPVQRGKWILTNLLGIPPTPPPPNVPALKENGDGKPLSLRERMEQHRADAVCAGCHKVMDPIGFALENFDARRAVAHHGRRLADRSLRHAVQRSQGRRPGGAAQHAGRAIPMCSPA